MVVLLCLCLRSGFVVKSRSRLKQRTWRSDQLTISCRQRHVRVRLTKMIAGPYRLYRWFPSIEVPAMRREYIVKRRGLQLVLRPRTVGIVAEIGAGTGHDDRRNAGDPVLAALPDRG